MTAAPMVMPPPYQPGRGATQHDVNRMPAPKNKLAAQQAKLVEGPPPPQLPDITASTSAFVLPRYYAPAADGGKARVFTEESRPEFNARSLSL